MSRYMWNMSCNCFSTVHKDITILESMEQFICFLVYIHDNILTSRSVIVVTRVEVLLQPKKVLNDTSQTQLCLIWQLNSQGYFLKTSAEKTIFKYSNYSKQIQGSLKVIFFIPWVKWIQHNLITENPPVWAQIKQVDWYYIHMQIKYFYNYLIKTYLHGLWMSKLLVLLILSSSGCLSWKRNEVLNMSSALTMTIIYCFYILF